MSKLDVSYRYRLYLLKWLYFTLSRLSILVRLIIFLLFAFYFRSARSLSSSHTPIMGSFMAQRAPPISVDNSNSIEEPLLGGLISTHSPPSTETKSMLCVVRSWTVVNILQTWFQTTYPKLGSYCLSIVGCRLRQWHYSLVVSLFTHLYTVELTWFWKNQIEELSSK